MSIIIGALFILTLAGGTLFALLTLLAGIAALCVRLSPEQSAALTRHLQAERAESRERSAAERARDLAAAIEGAGRK